MISVAVINESSAISDAAVRAMLPAFRTQWNRDLLPVWGLDEARFAFVPRGKRPKRDAWWVVFLDTSDQAKSLGYHDLTNEGLPISKVFVESLKADGTSISVAATHEICEMAVNPYLNGVYQDAAGTFWAGEVCDPVESQSYGYWIGDVLVTNFVTPAWFGHKHFSGALDFNGHARDTFAVLPGGYAQRYERGRWVQLNGNARKKPKHVTHAAPGSRRERRRRLNGGAGTHSRRRFG